jgi:hypothetical protein
MNLADNPLLHAVDELGSGDLGGTAIHKPGVGQTKEGNVSGRVWIDYYRGDP